MLAIEKENEIRIVLDRKTIGYIARAKREENHTPSLSSQHAECIRPYGELIGFTFQRGEIATGGDLCRSWNIVNMNSKGATYDIDNLIGLARLGGSPEIKETAKRMIHADYAKQTDHISAVLIIETPSESISMEFVRAWENLTENPKSFNILGGNCATRAYEVFVEAGIVKKASTILTPNQLFHYLARSLEKQPGYTVKKYFGYIGFEKNTENGYDLIIKL